MDQSKFTAPDYLVRGREGNIFVKVTSGANEDFHVVIDEIWPTPSRPVNNDTISTPGSEPFEVERQYDLEAGRYRVRINPLAHPPLLPAFDADRTVIGYTIVFGVGRIDITIIGEAGGSFNVNIIAYGLGGPSGPSGPIPEPGMQVAVDEDVVIPTDSALRLFPQSRLAGTYRVEITPPNGLGNPKVEMGTVT